MRKGQETMNAGMKSSVLGAFNARWLSPEVVANSFVPVLQWKQLVENNHSLLLGPRGCGKTTLLKMLTRPALRAWESSNRSQRFANQFVAPSFEAVYIPSDVRWSYEIVSLGDSDLGNESSGLRLQRLLVNLNTAYQILLSVERLYEDSETSADSFIEFVVSVLGLDGAIPTFRGVFTEILGTASTARGLMAIGDNDRLFSFLDGASPVLFGHALDIGAMLIEQLRHEKISFSQPLQWALCFDELEIAPEWLRSELLESLRSTSQNILLKLTWSPLLPSGLKTAPSASDDFRPIRLWYSHLSDPKAFCDDLTRDYLSSVFRESEIQATSVFSRSILLDDEESENAGAYEIGSTEYEVFRSLARVDQSFHSFLVAKGIDPENPVPSGSLEKDQIFRKIKPIAILRKEFGFLGSPSRRSRKSITVYAGVDAIYAMSEGNPRRLLNILSDMVNAAFRYDETSGERRLPYSEQAKVLNAASRRFVAQVRATPFRFSRAISTSIPTTLYGFVESVGIYFRNDILGEHFRLDPVGSFTVPNDVDNAIVEEIEQLLIIGAIVFVGDSSQDVPNSVKGSRFRLSYSLAPVFRLPLRLYRSASLDEIFSRAGSGVQLTFGFDL